MHNTLDVSEFARPNSGRRPGTGTRRRRRLVPVLGVVAGLVSLSALPGPASAAPLINHAPVVAAAAAPGQHDAGPAFGANLHAIWSDWPVLDPLVAKAGAAGIKWFRVDVGWSGIEPQKGQYAQWYLDRLDQTIADAHKFGGQVLFTLWLTPGWAGGGSSGHNAPTNMADYGRIASFLANYFKGRVAAWEIWNEPNNTSFFTGTASTYASLVKAAYPKIKAADPAAKVVVGATDANDVDYLTKAYAAGIGGNFDVISTHPYTVPSDTKADAPATNSAKFAYASFVHDLMVSKGDGAKPIWFTEFGWSTGDIGPSRPMWKIPVAPATQAANLVQAVEYARMNMPYVTNMFWYNLRERTDSDAYVNGRGLVKPDLTAKPAFTAVADYLTGTTPVASLGNLTFAEGSTNTTYNVPVTLDRPAPAPVTVTVTMTPGTADNRRWTAATQTVVVPTGARSANATVTVTADHLYQSAVTMFATIIAASGATIGQAVGTETITDPHTTDPVGIDLITRAGNRGRTSATTDNARITVVLSAPAPGTITLTINTSDLTAANNVDYWASINRRVTIAKGVKSVYVYIGLITSSTVHADRYFTVKAVVSAGNASLNAASQRVTVHFV